MTSSLIARSLLALACFALLLPDCSASHRRSQHRRSNDGFPNCLEYRTGSATPDVVVLPALVTPGNQQIANVDNIDYCSPTSKLTGSSIRVCDYTGPLPPSVEMLSILSQVVTCHSDGPCKSGMLIFVKQYCS